MVSAFAAFHVSLGVLFCVCPSRAVGGFSLMCVNVERMLH